MAGPHRDWRIEMASSRISDRTRAHRAAALTADPSRAATPPPAATDDERWPVFLTGGATVLCALLTVWRLGTKSLWYDEGFTVGLVNRPYGDFLWRTAHWEVNQSPYFVAFSWWFHLGRSETTMRLLSLLFAVAAVPALYALGRKLFDARTGAIAALLLAVQPLVIEWGQTMRGYTLVLLLVIVTTHLWLRAVERPSSTGRAVAYAVVAAVAIHAQFFAALVIATQFGWALVRRPLPRHTIVVASATLGMLCAPLAYFFVTRRGDPLDWLPRPSGSILLHTAKDVAGGVPNLVFYGVAVIVGLLVVGRAVRVGGRRDSTWITALPALWLVGPVAVVVGLSVTVKPLLQARFLLILVPAMALLAAVGVCRAPSRRLGLVLLAALLLGSAYGVVAWYREGNFEDWRDASRAVIAATAPGGPVVLEPSRSLFTYHYYERQFGAAPRKVVRPRRSDRPVGPVLVELRREGTAGEPIRNASYESWRNRLYRLRRLQRFDGLALRTYVRR